MIFSSLNPNPLYRFPDHPDIASALKTGYPRDEQPDEREFPIVCGYCDKRINDETQYRDDEYEYLCKDCLCELHERE